MEKELSKRFLNTSSKEQGFPDFVIRTVLRQMEEDTETGWRRQILFLGPTSFLDELCVHTGLLSSYVMPHPPHCHEHEELHIAFSKNLEFVGCDARPGVEYIKVLGKGSVFATDSNILHSFRNNASHPAAYFHIRWKNKFGPSSLERDRLNFYFSPGTGGDDFKRSSHEGSETIEIYAGPTRYLAHFRVLLVKIDPGGKIPFHRHAHAVIFVLLSGFVEILGKKIGAPGFAFMESQVPHYIVNCGHEPAALYAFELHGEA